MIDITSQEELAETLMEIGFLTSEVSQSTRRITFEDLKIEDREKVICLAIDATPNKLGTHIIVSIESGKMCIYFYEDVNNLFHRWCCLGLDISKGEIRSTIFDASNLENIRKRYPVFR